MLVLNYFAVSFSFICSRFTFLLKVINIRLYPLLGLTKSWWDLQGQHNSHGQPQLGHPDHLPAGHLPARHFPSWFLLTEGRGVNSWIVKFLDDCWGLFTPASRLVLCKTTWFYLYLFHVPKTLQSPSECNRFWHRLHHCYFYPSIRLQDAGVFFNVQTNFSTSQAMNDLRIDSWLQNFGSFFCVSMQ